MVDMSYLRANAREGSDAEQAAYDLAARFYGPQIGQVVARALHMTPQPHYGDAPEHGGAFALLHRIVEETDATVKDIRAAGLPDDVCALIDAVTARPGETPQQTAMRAVTDPHALKLILTSAAGHVLNAEPRTPGSWWPTDPDAWTILKAEKDRREQIEREARERDRYHYALPAAALKAAGVPIGWANAVRETFKAFTDPDRDHFYGYKRNRDYDRARVVRLDAAKHLAEIYQAGITPEQYATYVADTKLTWKQIPAWHQAGLTPALARSVGRRYDRNPDAAKAAARLTGDLDRVESLYYWALRACTRERDTTKYPDPRPIAAALQWHSYASADDKLGTVKQVRAAWDLLVQDAGGEDAARRRLDLMRIVPVPQKPGRGDKMAPDYASHPHAVAAWDATMLTTERIALLIAAGVTDPAEAVEDETAAISDEHLQLAASFNQA